MKLYTYPGSYRAWKALIAAELSGVQIEVPAFKFPEDCRTPAFAALNPNQKVPTLETPEGGIFETNAILRYVGRLRPAAGLYGANFFQQGQVDAWLDWSINELETARGIWIYPIKGYLAFDERAYQAAKKDVAKAMGVLNGHLLKNTYLVGSQVTLADICIACALVEMYKEILDPAFVKQFPNVLRWYNTIANQPEFIKVVGGKPEFAKEEKKAPKPDKKAGGGKADEKKDNAAAAGADGKKKGGEGKPKDGGNAKPPKEAKPAAAKEAKPAAAKDTSAADDIDLEAPKKKEKNPLDLLPASPMIFDVVKKDFWSVKPFNPKFFDTFWNVFDPAGYTIYTISYNYNSDNTVCYMTGNLVGGFLQRAEDCRKYAMGVVDILGKDEDTAPFTVVGCWIFRGPGIPKEMEECPDSSSYTWTKVDTTDAKQRQYVKDLFTADVINGLNNLDRRYFK